MRHLTTYGDPMEVRWVPLSAGLLATGALTLLCGALMTPTGDASETLQVVEESGSQWLLACVMYLLSSFSLTLGMPALYVLLRRHTPRLGLAAVGIFTIGTIALCGYAALLVFYRALVLTDALSGPVDDVTSDVGIAAFLAILLGCFFVGELLLAVAALRTPGIARWIPVVIGLHVLSIPLTSLFPESIQNVPSGLIAAALCGLAIAANEVAPARLPA
jgi:hypothetical protein